MKPLKLASLAALALLATGCVNTHKLARELARDPATLRIDVFSLYGNLHLTRTGRTNGNIAISSNGVQVVEPVAVAVEADEKPEKPSKK